MSSRSPSFLKRLRYRAEWLLVHLDAWGVQHLPRPIVLFFADVFGAAAAHFDRPGRRVALANLRTVFPDMPAARRRELVRQSYQHFARAQADLFWSPRLNAENVRELVDVSDLERLRREHGDRGFIFACLHYGGFEWIAVVLGLCGFECTVVTQAFKNKRLDPIYNQLREVSGHHTIRREGALLRLFKALRAGRSVVLAVDLTIPPQLPTVPVRCLGLLTSMTFAHAFLHRRSSAPIVPTYCEPLPDGRYRLRLLPTLEIPPDAANAEIAQACWDAFEPVVRQNPAPWLWMYKHWRYRPANSTERYPSYANESSWFEVRLARAQKL